MDPQERLKIIPWCMEEWRPPGVCVSGRGLLLACGAPPPPDPAPGDCDLQDFIERSSRFPIPFPIDTVRVQRLVGEVPADTLRRNIVSTYPVMHERVLPLMANFLLYKRKFGSPVERTLYQDMGVLELIDRLLTKRAVTFMKAKDQYKLISGVTGVDGWESVGTSEEVPPLVLSDCLSYDEMKLSALVYVSGYTYCINDGNRKNAGVPQERGVEREAVIIGVVGPRFKRVNRMEYEDVVVSAEQNTAQRGYGRQTAASAPDRREWRKLWTDFYQIPNYSYEEVFRSLEPTPGGGSGGLQSRWTKEADFRASERNKFAFLNIIGAGLGVWRVSAHQVDVSALETVYALCVAERALRLAERGSLQHVADVNLAYIQPSKHVLDLFRKDNPGDPDEPAKLFLKIASHPRGGINIQLQNREPSAELVGEHRGKLLVLTYPWDGNAHPGNEFWINKLCSSGDGAAACSTQVGELHAARLNPHLTAARTRLAGPTLLPLQLHCAGRIL